MSAAETHESARVVRRRPRERKQQIETAAALAFAESGYHQVSMSDVAQAVGISAPALYRHFPNKYALFVQTVFDIAHRLIVATEAEAGDPPESGADARARLDRILHAVITTTIDLRATGGVYRWEGRYLERADRDRLTREFRTLRERVEAPLAVLRPELDADDRALVTWAALGSIASITAHRTVASAKLLRNVLHTTAWRLLEARLPASDGESRTLARPEAAQGDGRRERLVAAAVELFHARGYHDVSIEDIAGAVELTPSGVYRHYESKAAVLLEACRRAADQLERATLAARASASSPVDVLRALCDDYVRHSFEHYQLLGVYRSDVAALDAADRSGLRDLQRAYLGEWVDELLRARPDLARKEALLLVHAGFNVVGDLGQALRFRTNAATSHRVSVLLQTTLGLV